MRMTLEQANAVIEGARARAVELDLRVTVAVVDDGGHLLALSRMDGAPPLSAQIAEAKASGTALWRRDGGEVAAMVSDRGAFVEAVGELTRLPLIPAAGSVLLSDGEHVIGAVGVSGATPDQDLDCARAGSLGL